MTNVNLSRSILLLGTGPTMAGSFSTTQVGRIACCGIEYALSWDWFIKAESLYASFANQNAAQAAPGSPTLAGTLAVDFRTSIVRAGFDYRF